jgi:hypothetical protein
MYIGSTLYDDPSDAIWAGCVAVPKAGRLCEHTIAQLPREDGDPAYFEVLDLTKDDRFKELPFVTAKPFFKYYCGVPLITKSGIPIGSLFALDDKVREPIGRTEKFCMHGWQLRHFDVLTIQSPCYHGCKCYDTL